MLRKLAQSLLLALCLMIGTAPAFAENGVQVNNARLELRNGTYTLVTSCSLDIGHALEGMLIHGIPLYFKTEVDVRLPRDFWFDDVPISKSRTSKIMYNVLTRRYTVSVPGSIKRSYTSLDKAISSLCYPPAWTLADASALTAGETYIVSVRMLFDASQLPKPLRVTALEDRDLKLVSDWFQVEYQP